MKTWDLGEAALARLRGEIGATLNAAPEQIRLAPHGVPKTLPDATHKLRVHGAGDAPCAFLLLSSRGGPGIVARGVAAARAASDALGPELGRVPLLPLADGEIEGRSYALMPLLEPISRRKPRWYLQRRWLRPVLFDWLGRSVQATRIPGGEADPEAFRRPLAAMTDLEGLPDALRGAAETALADLDRARWQPIHTLMHGDLWIGNVLIDSRLRDRPWPERFAVTDWPASRVRGFPFFDLVRLGRSLDCPRGVFRRALADHAARLDCTLAEARNHLLCALGTIAQDLEHFPLERFATMATACLDALRED